MVITAVRKNEKTNNFIANMDSRVHNAANTMKITQQFLSRLEMSNFLHSGRMFEIFHCFFLPFINIFYFAACKKMSIFHFTNFWLC